MDVLMPILQKALQIILKYRFFIILPIFALFIVLLLLHFIKTANQAKTEMLEKYDTKIKKTGALRGIQRKMSQKGIMYRLNNYNLMPSSYLVVRIFLGFFVGAISFILIKTFTPINMTLIIIISIILGIIGFFLTEIFFNLCNKSDNEAMLMDIYNSYVALKNQLEAGQYIGEILQYIYQNVTFERYKKAIMELIINISDKTKTSSQAIDIFRDRFDNPNIKKFCSILNCYYIYGIDEKFIPNLTREIESIITANTLREEESIRRKVGLVAFFLFFVIIVIVVYCIIVGFENINFF